MKSNSSLFIFTVFLFSLLSISLGAAEIDVNTYTTSRDFTISTAYNDINICACSSKYDTFTVTNTATWPAIYTVFLSKTDSQLSLSEQSFELYPGESKDVFLYVNANCNRGTEDFTVTVSSNLGVDKTIKKSIVKDRCQNIETWALNYTQEINPCTPKTFDIIVHNIGPFADTYVVSSNHDSNIVYNANSVNLEADQYAKISATATFDCSIYGQKDIEFKVDSLRNKLSATFDASLNIIKDYDFDLKVGYDISGLNVGNVELQVCNRQSSTQIPIEITNKGSVENTYTIDFDLPKNAKLSGLSDAAGKEKYEFTLKPEESKVFYVDIDSTKYRYQYKSKDAYVKVTSEYGDIVKESELQLNFEPCFEHETQVYDYSNSRSNPLETCAGYDYSYEINVQNNGLFVEDYSLSLENAPSTVKLSTDKVLGLEPGKNAIVNLYITGPENNDYHNIIVKVVSSSGMTEYSDTWIKAYDTVACHKTEIKADEFKINYQDASVKVPVKNNGIVDNSFIVTWTGDGIVSRTDVILLQLNESGKGTISLLLNSSNKDEGSYEGTLSLRDSSGATYSKVITLELEDKSFARKAFEYMAFSNICKKATLVEVVLIPVLLALIVCFMIFGPKYKYNFKNRLKSKTWVIITLLALFLVGVIAVIVLVGLPQTQTQVYNLSTNESSLTYEWLENDKLTIDAGKFFYDPDNSTLRYNVTGLKNIKAIVSGKIITFYPDKGWSGTEKARIVAYDNLEDGTTTSPEFTLKVTDTPRKSYLELYNIYCWYVNLAIYLLLLFLVFVAIFVKQEVRRRK
ncbi:MAG TPA: hypothetical protein VEC16_03795 [Alphaproteobacteria bacterium]|nr:hypothetical protein [Alphaproteobacteria bacterium]